MHSLMNGETHVTHKDSQMRSATSPVALLAVPSILARSPSPISGAPKDVVLKVAHYNFEKLLIPAAGCMEMGANWPPVGIPRGWRLMLLVMAVSSDRLGRHLFRTPPATESARSLTTCQPWSMKNNPTTRQHVISQALLNRFASPSKLISAYDVRWV